MKPMLFLTPVAMTSTPAAGQTEPLVNPEFSRPAFTDLRDAAPKIAAAASFELKLRRY